MSDAADRAETYFSGLWAKQSPIWEHHDVPVAQMDRASPVPATFCLTTIARLMRQPEAPIKLVQSAIAELHAAAPGQFYYPDYSQHITLLGLTPFTEQSDQFSPDLIGVLQRIVDRTLTNYPPIAMPLRGIGVVGGQVFIQVFPETDAWTNLRERLTEALLHQGLQPTTNYPDKAPNHLNIMRVVDGRTDELEPAFQWIQANRNRDLGQLRVGMVEMMRTDFVISRPHTEVLHTFTLGASNNGTSSIPDPITS